MDGVRVRWPRTVTEPLSAAGFLGVGVAGSEVLGVGSLDERREHLLAGVQAARMCDELLSEVLLQNLLWRRLRRR